MAHEGFKWAKPGHDAEKPNPNPNPNPNSNPNPNPKTSPDQARR